MDYVEMVKERNEQNILMGSFQLNGQRIQEARGFCSDICTYCILCEAEW